jgi:hypothetical protein
VYWRRRIILIGSLILVVVLLVVTFRALASDSGAKPAAAGVTASSSPTTGVAGTSPQSSSSVAGSTSAPQSSSSVAHSSTSAAPPPDCVASALRVQAVVGQTSYQVGDKPMLEMQVTNIGAAPCVQDLADAQIMLKVYNGESRVWGSHDCEVQKGSDPRVLMVGRAVRVSITWSGLTSQPHQCTSRQRVGAGTYTLYASLAGHTGTATQFSIS